MDLCYGNIKNGYKSYALPPLGKSDHDIVHLVPKYKPELKKSKPIIKTVPIWTVESQEHLKDCFETTDWNVFSDNCSDIDELTDTVNSYVNFCTDIFTVHKTIKFYPNNKPWVTREFRELLLEKKNAFKCKNKDELSKVQIKIKKKTFECKKVYKQKVEKQFKSNNMKDMWKLVKTMSGCVAAKNKVNVKNESDYVNELNNFYARFDIHDFSQQITDTRHLLSEACTQSDCIEISVNEVISQFKRINVTKASGPDKVKGNVLKLCCTQLAPIYSVIFNRSLT